MIALIEASKLLAETAPSHSRKAGDDLRYKCEIVDLVSEAVQAALESARADGRPPRRNAMLP